MLLNINPLLTGELLKRLDEMGHSDYVLIADANFPAHRLDPRAVEYPGTTVPQVVAAICEVLPLDDALAPALMDSGQTPAPAVQAEILAAAGHPAPPRMVDRWAYYDLAAGASVVVSTGELRLWANIILYKGLVTR
ncbi:RbsD/FucU family protein [Rhizomonospora bruguierae]|uniref:RbsD/FucU family protein n=1 Tax=Rhizomonospora bruguierae TaxID=1581705 RepID=UPI001BD166DC|nr:RbsD/FucU domain-containing protein [Micromonospora sp. NBRC 107566]